MPRLSVSLFIPVLVLLLLLPTLSTGAELKPRRPAAGDKCPVCGMFVAKYPDFACQALFRDGTVLHFDGAKDLFRYYLNPAAFTPGKKQQDIVTLTVTGYYSLTPIDGRKAWYVTGSDVFGPMGRELIPFDKEADAREFLADHKGKAIVRFPDVNARLLRSLE